MVHFEAKLKSKAIKHLLVLDYFGEETHQTNIYLKHILISLTSFMGAPNSMIIVYNTSLVTES
jgi:hypothetical protein